MTQLTNQQRKAIEDKLREVEALQRLAMTNETWDKVVAVQEYIEAFAELLGRDPLVQPR